MKWKIVYTNQAQKDAKKLSSSGLKFKAVKILELLEKDPFQTPPSFEKLIGDLTGAYSRRVNIQHRIVYQILEDQKTIKIVRMWSHYE